MSKSITRARVSAGLLVSVIVHAVQVTGAQAGQPVQWNRSAPSSVPIPASRYEPFVRIDNVAGQWIAVVGIESTSVYTSSDAIAWTKRAEFTARARDYASGGGLRLIYLDNGKTAVSADGSNWGEHEINATLRDLTYGTGRFYSAPTCRLTHHTGPVALIWREEPATISFMAEACGYRGRSAK